MSAFIHTDGNYQEIGGKAKTVEIRDFGSPFSRSHGSWNRERDRNLIGRSAPKLDEEEFHNRTRGKIFVL